MQYLKNYTKPELLGISHAAYASSCQSKGKEYDVNATTKYIYELIKHPITNEHALKIDSTDFLPLVFHDKLIDQEQMEIDGWLDIQEINA